MPEIDFAASYSHRDMTCSAIAYDLFSKMDLILHYRVNKRMNVSTACAVDINSGKCPDFELGLQYSLDKSTMLRAKLSDKGIVSGCFRVSVNDRMTVKGSLAVFVFPRS